MPWTFDANKAVLLVIDMQNDFVNEGAPMEVPMARELLPNMQRIVQRCREENIPIIYSQHTLWDHTEISALETAYNPKLQTTGLRKGTYGVQIIDALAPQPNETVIEKHRYDAFHNTSLETVINNIRGMNTVDTVIIIGTVTNICCESTARSAFMRDYKVLMVSDANGGLDEESQKATLTIIKKVFGRVMNTEELIEEISKQNVEAKQGEETIA
ncbi:isochorismatase family cysteine hydrolase [Bacillus sp. FJAT-50079]|uniref:isochorismatase family protein n=1 Tax=Bacillus sp. FJAT-50079 TaxID=2833577 RepID=UPI001BC9756B|nr:isochorismatase family cysteine hydrolase [Bacillus sp. FJAT-50079]MBS4208314.1 cysteine hydrolase [Bacillus sp. FJAT-50079]